MLIYVSICFDINLSSDVDEINRYNNRDMTKVISQKKVACVFLLF